MPNIFEMFKNYFIESENDIPQKYREEIEKRLSSKECTKQTEKLEITPGKLGKVVSEKSKIEDIFKNEQDFYFGHGTPGGEQVINSILENGLMTVNPDTIKVYGNTLRGLDSTTFLFGKGTDSLFSKQKDLLDNWPHKNSKNVVIISIPRKYALKNTEVRLADLYEAFYIGSEEEGYKLRPEFIKGIYNADSHSFTLNDNFYQNLEVCQQEELFREVKQQYIMSYAKHSMVAPDKSENRFSLDEIELEQLNIEWYKKQLEGLRRDKTFNTQMLNTGLHEMSKGAKISDFNDTTHSLIGNVKEDKENIDEVWLLDDWE